MAPPLIATIEDLRAHVALARQVEMSTIPPYLYAGYSIQDPSSDACRTIMSVVVEEMLHVALTTNLLLALGGEPDFGPDLMPSYPGLLAHHTPDLVLRLQRCAPEVVRDTFMVIERPARRHARPEADRYETLGQFYAALEQSIAVLGAEVDLFADPQRERQMSDPSFYGQVRFTDAGSGGLMHIDDVASAMAALEVIVDQGEGVGDHHFADPGHRELTHFYKFEQLASGAVPIGPTWPVITDPARSSMPDSIHPTLDLVDALYTLTFRVMAEVFSGRDQAAAVSVLYPLMSHGMAGVATHLMGTPIGGGLHAGPTFALHRFGLDPVGETLTIARTALAADPGLESVVTALEGPLRRWSGR